MTLQQTGIRWVFLFGYPPTARSSVLRYYRNFYNVTHRELQNVGRVSLSHWLTEVIHRLESGDSPPKRPPAGLVTGARASGEGAIESHYRGTVFDARIADVAVRTYSTFADASRAIENPSTFIGVSEDVTALVRDCRWENLLEYADRSREGRASDDLSSVLESGILTQTARLADNEERECRMTFVRLRNRAEVQGRLLPREPS